MYVVRIPVDYSYNSLYVVLKDTMNRQFVLIRCQFRCRRNLCTLLRRAPTLNSSSIFFSFSIVLTWSRTEKVTPVGVKRWSPEKREILNYDWLIWVPQRFSRRIIHRVKCRFRIATFQNNVNGWGILTNVSSDEYHIRQSLLLTEDQMLYCLLNCMLKGWLPYE